MVAPVESMEEQEQEQWQGLEEKEEEGWIVDRHQWREEGRKGAESQHQRTTTETCAPSV